MRGPGFKEDDKWQLRFAMITRGFVEEFAFAMSRNAWVLYLALATFYNFSQQRSFPKLEMLEAVCPLSRSSRSRGLRELVNLGLVEVWGERRGRRRRTFYRLLNVDARGHHLAQVQQVSGGELMNWTLKGSIPPDYEWVQRAYLKSWRRVCV